MCYRNIFALLTKLDDPYLLQIQISVIYDSIL